MAEAAERGRVREDGQKRRKRVLDEAQRLIGARGYHGFGIQELAERCGLTKPGLLHHFGSKDQLLIALLRDRDARHEEAVIALLGDGYDASAGPVVKRALFVRGLRTIVARNIAQPELIRLQAILRVEAINAGHPAHAYFTAREAGKLQLIAERVAPFAADPVSAARQILALVGGLEEQWLREQHGFDLLEEFDRAIVKLLPPAPAV